MCIYVQRGLKKTQNTIIFQKQSSKIPCYGNNDANADPFNAMLLRRSMQYACMYARPCPSKK